MYGEGVAPMGGAYKTLIVPSGKDAGLDHEAKLGGLGQSHL